MKKSYAASSAWNKLPLEAKGLGITSQKFSLFLIIILRHDLLYMHACSLYLYCIILFILCNCFLVERPLEKQVGKCPEELPFLNNIK